MAWFSESQVQLIVMTLINLSLIEWCSKYRVYVHYSYSILSVFTLLLGHFKLRTLAEW